jgi:hypothetical protein
MQLERGSVDSAAVAGHQENAKPKERPFNYGGFRATRIDKRAVISIETEMELQ